MIKETLAHDPELRLDLPDEEALIAQGVALGYPEAAVRHSIRFRKVANRYPLQVTYAYGGDLARAAADTDEQVAATVARWERQQGLRPRDWVALGVEEGRTRPTQTPPR